MTLRRPQPDDRILSFVQSVWPSLSENQFASTARQYARLSKKLEVDLHALSEHPDVFALASQEELLPLVQALRQRGDVSRNEALALVRKSSSACHDDERVLRTLRCAINVWLSISMGPNLQRRQPLAWGPLQTLKGAITSLFQDDVTGQVPAKLPQQQLPKDLTAASLVTNYGFLIEWTHDLSAHLAIDWRHKVLTVYEHKILAYNHVRFGSSALPVPDQLFEEAIDTLNLLFPFDDGDTERLLEKHDMAFHGLGFCGRPRKLLLNDYRYWRGQVGDLYQVTQGPALGVQQLFLDDDGANVASSLNFWIAVVVGLLTVMGMAIAIASLVYSVKQYELGLVQYELSVAQACVDSSVRERVPHLCGG